MSNTSSLAKDTANKIPCGGFYLGEGLTCAGGYFLLSTIHGCV